MDLARKHAKGSARRRIGRRSMARKQVDLASKHANLASKHAKGSARRRIGRRSMARKRQGSARQSGEG